MWIMRMTVILIVIDAVGMVPKGLEKVAARVGNRGKEL